MNDLLIRALQIPGFERSGPATGSTPASTPALAPAAVAGVVRSRSVEQAASSPPEGATFDPAFIDGTLAMVDWAREWSDVLVEHRPAERETIA
jgi:hypothetical protein